MQPILLLQYEGYTCQVKSKGVGWKYHSGSPADSKINCLPFDLVKNSIKLLKV